MSMLVIPRLDLRAGRCEYDAASRGAFLLEDPVVMARLWRVQNAKTLLIVDLASASPELNVHAVASVCNSVDIPLQLDCTSNASASFDDFLRSGVYRLVLPDSVGPDVFAALASEHGARRIAIRVPVGVSEERLRSYVDAGCCRMFVDLPPDAPVSAYARMAPLGEFAPHARFTVEGPVYDYPSLKAFVDRAPRSVDSIVLGKPLYEQRFPCQASWCWNRIEDVELGCFTTAEVLAEKKPVGKKKGP